MTSSVASKNQYELLGNDQELEPEPPTTAIEKPVQRTGKRNAAVEGPQHDAARPAAGGRGGRAAVSSGPEKDVKNRADQKDDGLRQARTRDLAENRGGRRGNHNSGRGGGQGIGPPRNDRHNRSGVAPDHPKQSAKGWGDQTADAEFEDEKEGLAYARQEKEEGIVAEDAKPVDENGAPVEAGPEDKPVSYDQYLADLAKKANLAEPPFEVRQPNEGSSNKFPEGKILTRADGDDYFEGTGGKPLRERTYKPRNTVAMDYSWVESKAESSPRGGRGPRGNGGRGRGGDRGGDRGGRSGRGRGGDRGGERGGFRGGSGGQGPNIGDSSAFPSLGA